jgi:circadian clock protein KaiB
VGEPDPGRGGAREWVFRVYVAGATGAGERTVANLEAILARHLPDQSSVEVVDLREDPARAREEGILAVPTVVRLQPEPRVRVIGDLSDPDEVARSLNLPRGG